MTDRTHPDSGSTHIIRYALELGLLWIDGSARDKVREALDALDTLEAQLSAIRAGGVSGPLMGQPQAMPDLSALTERGAKAWAGVDAQGLRDGVASAWSEPVAYAIFSANGNIRLWSKARIPHPDAKPLYLHPSPPEGMVGGWMPIETAPRDGTPIWLYTWAGQCEGYWNYGEWVQDAVYCTYDGAGGPAFQGAPTHWMPLPPPPTSSADSGKGE